MKEEFRKILKQKVLAACITADEFHGDAIECAQDSAIFHFENAETREDYEIAFNIIGNALVDEIA